MSHDCLTPLEQRQREAQRQEWSLLLVPFISIAATTMAVLLETSKGDIVIDLFVEDAPMTCKNFLKLCKIKYYNNSLFHNVQRDFIAQTGDPTGTGKGGDSLYGMLYGSQARFFDDEISPKRKHGPKGCVGMASAGPDLNASQFYITLGAELSSLDERHTLFGQVSEGLEVLEGLNEVPVDNQGRPLQNIRIRHTIVLDDPFDDPPQLADLMPDASPPPTFEHGDRLEEDWVPEQDERPAEEVEKEAAAAEAKNRAVVLEMIGDLPEAEVKPPSNMLFVCKLNPVTTEEDLEIIFSRFGNVTSCDIIKDHKTGDSLCYAFIGYDNDQSCEAAYFKMNNVLIDDRRIKVDFSQSVAHIWKQFRRHGKAGGNAGMAAEADAHIRGQQEQQQQQRGPPSGSRYIDLKGPAQQDRGMLFDHADPVEQQQQRGQQRWDQPQRPHSSKRSRSASRDRDRSRRRSRSRSNEHKQKQHKKHHKHHKEDKKQRQPDHADDGPGREYGDRHDRHRGSEGRARDARQQEGPYSSHSREAPDRGRDRGDRREGDAGGHSRQRERDYSRQDSPAGRSYERERGRQDSSRDRGADRHSGRGYERDRQGSDRTEREHRHRHRESDRHRR